MNSNQDAPWWVLVERLGPHGKGRKFHCGAETEAEALSIAEAQNHRERVEDANVRDVPFAKAEPRYGYTVTARPKAAS